MNAQAAIAGLGATIGGAVGAVAKLKGGSSGTEKDTLPKRDDLEMATRARKQAQLKINAIVYNKELSKKAMTRRIGKVLDDFKKGE